jgi:UDP:flavonoid glycosyltransferase YjiC (YdhE family)
MRKGLFLPNYLGGGFGHIARCVALAEAFRLRGCTATFAINGPHAKLVEEAGFEVHRISRPKIAEGKGRGPAYVYVPGMAYQIVRDGFDNQHEVKSALRDVMKVVEMTKPDMLVGDGYPITWLTGKKAGLPVIQFVKSAVHPESSPMVWWERPPEGLIVPDVRPVFGPCLKGLGLPKMTGGAEELLRGDLLLLPSIPALDPMDPLPPNTHYVGPIIRPVDGARPLPFWWSSLKEDKPVVYVTAGGAAAHGGSSPFFDTVLKAFLVADWRVIISTGGKVDPATLGSVPPHIRVVRWVPGPEMIARSDLVVFHGGYTRMEILIQGLPSVVVPFHSEQEYYGRILETLGVATVLHYSDDPYECLPYTWKGGNRWLKSEKYTVHAKRRGTMSPEALRSAVDQCLHSRAMRERAQALKVELESYGGCNAAVDLIASKLR